MGWIALLTGKSLHYTAGLSSCSETYTDWLLAGAYTRFKLGREQLVKEDPYYALLTYYIANTGERILNRISDPELYEEIYYEALKEYEEAQELYRTDTGGHYWREDNVQTNIGKGIMTLRRLA